MKYIRQTRNFSQEPISLSLCLMCQVCVQDFCEELEYWGLDDLHMEPCCQHTYYRARSEG